MKEWITLFFIDGQFIPDQSNKDALPSGIIFQSTGGALLEVSKNCIVSKPIHLKFLSSGKARAASALRNIIHMADNSQLVLIEEYTGDALENYTTDTRTELHLHKNAKVDYYKLQHENHLTSHSANISVQQKASSHINMFFSDLGSRSARTDLAIHLAENAAVCHLRGLYFLTQDQQKIENYIHVDHQADYGTSSMLYKGILDKKSQAVFNGKVSVQQKTRQNNAEQANHNLLLSTQAEVNTRPQLEIYADDLKCTHGATIGQLDQEALFYLRSRGIEKNNALKILTGAFAEEIINKIALTTLRQIVHQQVSQYEQL